METSRGKTSYGTSYGTIGSGDTLENYSCDVDPWAIVDLVDDSEKWTSIAEIMIKSRVNLIQRSIKIFHVFL